jgi:hypothetical protein
MVLAESDYVYYLTYSILCVALCLSYIRIKSTEGVIITTKEFKIFQTTFLTAYSVMIFGELIANASFYHTMLHINVPMESIIELYIVTVASTTCFGILLEIVDIGSRKTKCCLSALLFAASLFSMCFEGHEGRLMLGRVVYGAATALLHSSFNSYLVNQHATMGFPDDWLTQTFTMLTHSLALVAGISGSVGETFSSTGDFGAVSMCIALFLLVLAYMVIVWKQDISGPKFLLSSFMFGMGQAVKTIQSSRAVTLVISLTALAEAGIVIFVFYWAPWLQKVVKEEVGMDSSLPYEVVYSTYISGSMIGTYLVQLYSQHVGMESIFQGILLGTSVFFFIGSSVSTPSLVLLISVVIHLCIGSYWASVGLFRGKYISQDQRSACITISKVMTMIFAASVLKCIHHSSLLILMACSFFFAGAGYCLFLLSQIEGAVQGEDECED